MTTPTNATLAIGIDIGATKIAAALVDRQGSVIHSQRSATKAEEGATAVIHRIATQVNELLDAGPAPVAGIGIGVPGYVDPVTGTVTNAVNLAWDNVHIVSALKRHLDTEMGIWSENDANVMALGEYHYGAAQACRDFVYISIGTGMGSGVMVDGKLVHGADNRATELGHLSLDPGGRTCACGLHGCMETVVSGPGIAVTARELMRSGRASTLTPDSVLSPEQVLHAALDENDPLAIEAFDHAALWLGKALSACVTLLNPARIVIGGGMGLAGFDLLVPGVYRELQRRVISQCLADLTIVRSQVSSSAVGASSLVWQAEYNRHA